MWRAARSLRWHQWARIIALLFLAEQWWDLSPAIPSSEGILIACIGALFAPVPEPPNKE